MMMEWCASSQKASPQEGTGVERSGAQGAISSSTFFFLKKRREEGQPAAGLYHSDGGGGGGGKSGAETGSPSVGSDGRIGGGSCCAEGSCGIGNVGICVG